MKTTKQQFGTTACAVVVVLGLLLSVWRISEENPEARPSRPELSPGSEVVTSELKTQDYEYRPPSVAEKPPEETVAGVDEVELEIARLLARRWDTSDPEARGQLISELRRLEALRTEVLHQKARALELPMVTDHGAALVGFEGELPLYDISHNAEAAVSVATDKVRETPPYMVDGKDRKIGLWDVLYAPSQTHQEFDGEVDIKDNAQTDGQHATHVAATIMGRGIDPRSKGMAPLAKLYAYSSTDMYNELASVAATDDSDFSNLFVSVHPYGSAVGWEYNGTQWFGVFSDDQRNENDYSPLFGQYSGSAASWDGMVKQFPYHLMIKSAGNHADDRGPADEAIWSLNGTSTYFEYESEDHPKADGALHSAAPRGFGTIDARASAKNILTVGSVSDAVAGGVRDLSSALLSEFSSAGPTDDGRIKPDLVTNGETVYSADGASLDAYLEWSGTSMAAASAGGSALLLVDLQKDLSGKAVLASTLKGLLIHTADDLGNPGPDYRYGWGLMNVERAAEFLVAHDAAGEMETFRYLEESLFGEEDDDYFMIEHDGSSPLRITLCWTDEPGSWTNSHNNRTPRLVNDLDVRVVGPDGTTHYPFVMPYSSTFADGDLDLPATRGINTVDNVEQVLLPGAPAGEYVIHVELSGELTGPSQDYSLLLSGAQLAGAGVEVEFPVADQSYVVLDDSDINHIVDADEVFSGQDHAYGVTWSPSGLLTASVGSDGKVDLHPTATAFGEVELTLTARDATGGLASDTFTVFLRGPKIYIDASTPVPASEQDGNSWETAFRYLQDGLTLAIDGQQIWVAQGVYYPDVVNGMDSDLRTASFVINGKVSLYGGFAGGETSLEERDPLAQPTILSGDISQDDSQQPIATRTQPNLGDWNNSYRVVDMSDGYNDNVFDGFIVTSGYADGWPDHLDGGGIYGKKDPLISNCLITGNYASQYGGGVFVYDNSPVFSNTRIEGNEAGLSGGGVYVRKGGSEFHNCRIRGNEAGDGGGVYLESGDPAFQNCLISGNVGFFGAGGLQMADGELTVVNCTFSANYCVGTGGAVKITGVKLAGTEEIPIRPIFRNSIIWNNWGSGGVTSPSASVHSADKSYAPAFSHCLVANSGGSDQWEKAIGSDEGGNLDANPLFVTPLDPAADPSIQGDFRTLVGTPIVNAGLQSFVLADHADLDGDGDTGEDVEIDLAGRLRVVSLEIDLGAYEFVDIAQIDSDGDGLSDAFEISHGGESGSVDPASDLDGDGLSALAEFVHGLDPNAPLTEPVAEYTPMEHQGTEYLCVTFHVDPAALPFVELTVERRGDLKSPLGWRESQTLEISSVPSTSRPGMLELTYRSLVPFGQEGMEFLRVRHEVVGAAP